MLTATSPDLQIQQLKSRIDTLKIVLLVGGVGGAKLADGFARLVDPEKLTIIVNTGDDFHHLGLTICPDMDTVMYTLAGAANPETGWGRIGESWRTMAEVGRLGGPEWFRLGDLDLATHLVRSHILAGGGTLTESCRHLCRFLGIETTILPMSDQPSPTMVETVEGMLPFQNWFVEQQWQPAVKKVHFPEDVRATSQVTAALQKADLVAIAPSNPFVSIDPILNAYPVRAMVSDVPELVVAVSPIIEGKAVKGPAGKMMAEMNMEVSPAAVAEYYGDVIDAFVYDERDEVITNTSLELLQTDTFMRSQADRVGLAMRILQFSMELLEK